MSEKVAFSKKIKAMPPFLLLTAIAYCALLPLTGYGLHVFMMFVACPFVCFAISFVYGINYSFNPLLPILEAALFMPVYLSVFLSYGVWDLAVIHLVVPLIGNALGMIPHKRGVRIKSLSKVLWLLIIAAAIAYVTAAIVSWVKMSEMRKITYQATAFGFVIRKDTVDFENNTAERIYFGWNGELGEPYEQNKNSFDESEEFRIKLVFSLSLFPLWREEYVDWDVFDGDQYSIIRSYEDSESVVSGSNAYPLTYRFVMSAIENAVS